MSGELAPLFRLVGWVIGLGLLLVVAFPALTILIQFRSVALTTHMAAQQRDDRVAEQAAFEARYAHVANPTGVDLPLRVLDTLGGLEYQRATIVILLPKALYPAYPSSVDATWALRLAAPSYADAECTVLLVSLASRCQAGQVTISPVPGGIELRMSLLFVQRDELGALPDASNLILGPVDFVHEDDRIVQDAKRGGVADGVHLADLEGTANSRERIYRRVASNCAAIRREFGNCWIYGLKVSATMIRPKGKEIVATTGKSDYAYLRADPSS